MRTVSPTGCWLPNSLRATSLPMKTTRRCSRTSSASMNRPAAAGCVRMTPYVGGDATDPVARLLGAPGDVRVAHELGTPRLDERQHRPIASASASRNRTSAAGALAAGLHARLSRPNTIDTPSPNAPRKPRSSA